ncbi:MAG: hypothetical protein EPO40_28010 [Myxococcaceae bacterium]|nr:MAG: hypothetical protein EPO40_28010 [Myxococcaceae bacterium]
MDDISRALLDQRRNPSVRPGAFASAVSEHYEPFRGEGNESYDFLSRDKQQALEFKFAFHGVRDLHAAAIQLALQLTPRPELWETSLGPRLRRVILVAYVGRISLGRIEEEWKRVLDALRPDLPQRLALVAVAAEGAVTVPPHDRELGWLAQCALASLNPDAQTKRRALQTMTWTEKAFDVWMVLLDAWLGREAPLLMSEIARRSRCSTPTVAATVRHLEDRNEVSRTSARRAGLRSLPRGSLGEILVLADHLRGTVRYVDGSGRRPDPEDLLQRVGTKAPASVAVGGVAAARQYVPAFDLNGLPRVDVTTLEQDASSWVARLDPALRPATHQERSPVLVVHHRRRAAPDEPSGRREPYPLASPAEVLLDLYDLRLTEQADDFVQTLRRKRDDHV